MAEYSYDDLELLSRLAQVALRTDAVPPAVMAAARASFTWRTVDDELAELTYDSGIVPELAGVRSYEGARQLTFEAPGLVLEMELSEGLQVVGQVVPPQPASIELRHPGGAIAVQADDLGRFAVAGVPAGPVSLRCQGLSGSAAITTDWLVV
ncbi:MAG: hypothetical protein ACRDZW_00270 [Acidimicrobiales bacterium]